MTILIFLSCHLYDLEENVLQRYQSHMNHYTEIIKLSYLVYFWKFEEWTELDNCNQGVSFESVSSQTC